MKIIDYVFYLSPEKTDRLRVEIFKEKIKS